MAIAFVKLAQHDDKPIWIRVDSIVYVTRGNVLTEIGMVGGTKAVVTDPADDVLQMAHEALIQIEAGI